MNRIKVSIVIPAYNVQNYIERCIKSALNQTLNEIEIIVVNDGSTDKTQEIIEKISLTDSRLSVINKKNEGLVAARQDGVNISKGEYIQFIDGDDWIESTACEKMYNFAKKEELDIVVSDIFRDDDHGKINIWHDLREEKNFYNNIEYLFALFQRKSRKNIWNKLILKKLFSNQSFPKRIMMGEDFIAMAILASRARRIGKYNEAFVHYIINPLSTTQDQVSKKMYQTFKVYEYIERYFQDNGLYDTFKEIIDTHKQQAIFYFLKKKPYFGDEDYEKGLQKTLEYFKSKPTIHKGLNFSRRLKLIFLKMFPTRNNIVRMIKFHNKS